MNIIQKLFLKNDTLIIKHDIPSVTSLFEEPTLNEYNYKRCTVADSAEIAAFYKKNNYSTLINQEEVSSEMSRGNAFHAIYNQTDIIAGLWIHRGIVNIDAPSFEALKTRHSHVVAFNEGVIYSSHNLVDCTYRGNHLYTTLLLKTLWDYKNESTYIYITGIDNNKMIASSFKYMGQIIGFVRTIRIFKVLWYKKRILPINGRGGGVLEEYSSTLKIYTHFPYSLMIFN